MRLHIRVGNEHYYDIGLRNKAEDSELTQRFGEWQPKYLEDFINRYGKKRIEILSYGDLIEKRNDIDKLLI